MNYCLCYNVYEIYFIVNFTSFIGVVKRFWPLLKKNSVKIFFRG